jgi:hypothetical protein
MTDASQFDGTLDLSSGDITLGGLLATFGAVAGVDVVQAVDQTTLSSEYAATEGRIGVTASDAVYVGDGSAWQPVTSATALRDTEYASGSGTATLASGSATVDTGISSTSAVIDAAASPVDPDADAKVETSVFWDDSAGTYKVEIDEVDTAVGGFDANYRWEQVRE